ncbi:hypothetical protein CROQUDRAFT_100075 [Cronartium quercuum f. sp. fusiforme G11]|uniref:Uncharacterized protein n=1 Tax=Cronartium quercuum f. sp. fusiforme G11 TaxID=708437 RepID=A0A9P6N6E9_9BASI|nr:hypothetical protein CROQUDRAFT_100075 [Cronartium quercuum f. sp. fusiforme G11]
MEEDHEAVVAEELNLFSGIPKVQPSSKPVASGSGACLEVTNSDDSNLDIPITSCVKPSSKVHPIGPLVKTPCASGQLINSAVKQEKIHFQTEHSLATVKKDIALAKLDKFPNHKTAMALFNASSAVYFEDPLACMVAAEVLFDEDKVN